MHITEDLHLHTYLSKCAKNGGHARDYVAQAQSEGLSVIAFTDHMWDSAVPGASDWYKPQDMAHIGQLRAELAELPAGPVRVLFGCETECDKNGVVGITQEAASRLDILLVPNSHTHMLDFVMPREYNGIPDKHGAFMVRHFMDIIRSPVARYITAIPHPFAAVGKSASEKEEILASISDAAFAECFAAAREMDIALELNTSVFACIPEQQLRTGEFARMYMIAREAGCRFTFGTDAHAVAHMVTLPAALPLLDAAGITQDMILVP